MINKDRRGFSYFKISILLFCSFLLEYFSIFMIEVPILKMDISNYTANQRSIHHLIVVVLWILYISCIMLYSKKKLHYPIGTDKTIITKKDWFITMLCLLGCKVMTFIDWHTFKVIGEAQGKNAFQFTTQYMYYFVEVIIIVLIIMFGQKAMETHLHKASKIAFGGLILAFTWGIFHFVSRGVGIEIWNGISCVIFSLLSGMMYVKLGRRFWLSYILIAIGYLL